MTNLLTENEKIIEKRKYLAGRIYEEGSKPDANIMAYKDGMCEGCTDAISRAIDSSDTEENACNYCTCCPYICSNKGRTGLISHIKGKQKYGQIIGTPIWKLLMWEAKRCSETGKVDLDGYIKKAEELGLMEITTGWKLLMIESKIESMNFKINKLILKLFDKR